MSFYVDLLEKISVLPDSKVDPIWIQNMNLIHNLISKEQFSDFLHIQQIQAFMFMDARGELLDNQMHLISKYIDNEEIQTIIQDNQIGNPPCFEMNGFITNHNNIHHLYHQIRYMRRCGVDSLKSSKNVLEWGGGYGNFAKIFINAWGADKTYTIVDLPEMCILQKWYLEQTFGEDRVNFISSTEQSIMKGKINILPVSIYLQKDLLEGEIFDFFISTWALSESPLETQQVILDKKFYGAENFLVGFHQCGNQIPFMKESTNLGTILKKRFQCSIEDIKIIPGVNYYAFR